MVHFSLFIRSYARGFHLTVERDWFWFFYALWLASVFSCIITLVQTIISLDFNDYNCIKLDCLP